MKFCMVTTFFGAHSFGGDAAYVERLSQALCRRGHEVHVYYCVDAWRAVRGGHPPREYTPPPGLHLHPIQSRFGILSPLVTQTTGHPSSRPAHLRETLDAADTDVVHFHNISLVGGPGVLGIGANRRAVRLMTAHEHWLICPMHLLWKYDRQPCDAPNCLTCCLKGRRPPQALAIHRARSNGVSATWTRSYSRAGTLEEHRRRGLDAFVSLVHAPYFLPDDWSRWDRERSPGNARPPLLGAAGRLVKMKGFQRLIPLMRYLPEVDLRIAGTGPHEPALRAWPATCPTCGSRDSWAAGLARLFHGARAVVVPSLFPETFGYVVLEAFAVGRRSLLMKRVGHCTKRAC